MHDISHTSHVRAIDDLDTLEQQLMAHSQAQSVGATQAKSALDANMKTLTELSLELKKATKVCSFILYYIALLYVLTHHAIAL